MQSSPVLTPDTRKADSLPSHLVFECMSDMHRLEQLNRERWPEHLRRLSDEHRPIVEAYLNRNPERRPQFLRSLLGDLQGRDH